MPGWPRRPSPSIARRSGSSRTTPPPTVGSAARSRGRAGSTRRGPRTGSSPRWPRRSHHDAGIGLTWELKDTLPSKKRVYYGKLLKGRPLLVALELFPAFYAQARGRQRARDYRDEYAAGRMSHTARRLMDALAREHPQYTRGLRANTFMLEPSKTREVERAMAELQQGLWVVKTEERDEPTFSYRWDLVEAWLPET